MVERTYSLTSEQFERFLQNLPEGFYHIVPGERYNLNGGVIWEPGSLHNGMVYSRNPYDDSVMVQVVASEESELMQRLEEAGAQLIQESEETTLDSSEFFRAFMQFAPYMGLSERQILDLSETLASIEDERRQEEARRYADYALNLMEYWAQRHGLSATRSITGIDQIRTFIGNLPRGYHVNSIRLNEDGETPIMYRRRQVGTVRVTDRNEFGNPIQIEITSGNTVVQRAVNMTIEGLSREQERGRARRR